MAGLNSLCGNCGNPLVLKFDIKPRSSQRNRESHNVKESGPVQVWNLKKQNDVGCNSYGGPGERRRFHTRVVLLASFFAEIARASENVPEKAQPSILQAFEQSFPAEEIRQSLNMLQNALQAKQATAIENMKLQFSERLKVTGDQIEPTVNLLRDFITGIRPLEYVGKVKDSWNLTESVHSDFTVERFKESFQGVFGDDFPNLAAKAARMLNETSAEIWDSARLSSKVDSLGQPLQELLHKLEGLSGVLNSRMDEMVSSASLDRAALSKSVDESSKLLLTKLEALGREFGTRVPTNQEATATTTIFSTYAGDTKLITAATVAIVAGAVTIIIFNKKSHDFMVAEDLPLRYDPDAIKLYFRKRPLNVLLRSMTVLVKCSALVSSILVDKAVGGDKRKEKLRATQLVDLITSLGPTAIKIGQALSIRPDILPVAYLEELQKLQDRVPPFPNEEARRIILEGLGKPANELFSEISEEPIAAASLGQVYKAKLLETGDIVAVKVQRPGVLEGISRDLFIMRVAARALQSVPNVHSDLLALLDNWALRFFDELDYVQEGKNAERFAEDMRTLNNVTVPRVYMQYTSRKVLTTEWIEGERLSESKAADLLQLVTVALNCYLMQLLESGFLHADPHPGNLLRTPEGRLCVLDYGLMTEVTESQRYAFMDYIMHLMNSDYPRVASDLVALGFVPPGEVDPEKTAAVVPQLSRVLGELVQGGGARKIDFQQVTDDLTKMSEEYVFVIPPYFALILRAFSVLEGIGLEANPDYTIVEECYPYLSKRLLTDDSPRARAALKYFLYGGRDQLDVQRVEEIISGFQTFRKGMSPLNQGPSNTLDPTATDALMLLFAPDGSYLQEIILAELVRAVDALSRDAIAELWRYFYMRIPLPAALSVPGSWPLPLPGLFLGSAPVASLSEEDQQSLQMVRRLWALLEQQQANAPGLRGIARGVIPLMRHLFPGVTTAAQRFLVMLLQRQALRFADDLDGRNSVSQWNKDPAAVARRIKPLKLRRNEKKT